MTAYQLADLTLQVLDAVQLPLAAALGSDAVLAPPPDVVDELQLLRGQFVHLYHDLEVVTWKIGDLVHGEGECDLQEKKLIRDDILVSPYEKGYISPLGGTIIQHFRFDSKHNTPTFLSLCHIQIPTNLKQLFST